MNDAPTALNTLNELAAALNDNPDTITNLVTVVGGKAAIGHTHDDRYYTEKLYAKRKNLFNEYDSGKKYNKGSLNLSVSSIRNINPIKDSIIPMLAVITLRSSCDLFMI